MTVVESAGSGLEEHSTPPEQSAQPLSFTVYGEPKPQGSKKGFVNKKTGAVIMTEQAGKPLVTWREDVKQAALKAMADVGMTAPHDSAVAISIEFYHKRPKYHFRTGKNSHLLKDNAPHLHTSTPDADKEARSVLDALTAAGVWRDDSLVAVLQVVKRYVTSDHPTPGAEITVRPA